MTCTAVVAISLATSAANAQWAGSFDKIFPLEGVPGYSAEEMVINCGGEYPNARARIYMSQRYGRSVVMIRVRNAPPNALFTIWLKLASPSPLTGAGVTALANPADIPDLAAITPSANLTETAEMLGLSGDDGSGGTSAANGFTTDERGNGLFFAYLKFPIMKGAYQFQEFDESLAPVAIDNAPFTLRLATHCTDERAHGLVAGKHEMFFDWKYPQAMDED